MRETVYKLSCFWVNVLVIRNTLFLTIFYTFAFCAFQFATCLVNVMAAFRCRAFLAFPSVKHEKQQKQHAVFLMQRSGQRLSGIFTSTVAVPLVQSSPTSSLTSYRSGWTWITIRSCLKAHFTV